MLGALISAGANLIGGFLGRQSNAEANDSVRAANELNAQVARENIAKQEEFARSGIQWRAEDARKAGIHPLYALGAQPSSFSPVHVGAVGGSADMSLPTAMANMGQDLGRAIDSTRTGQQKVDAYTGTVQALTLQRMGLENELLSSQIRKINQTGGGPNFPGSPGFIDGQGDVTYVESADGRKFIVSRPELASQMQTHYGEGAGDIAGAEAFAIDIWKNAQARKGTYRGQDTYYHTGGGF